MEIPKSVNRILFVCYGNLCRSVLADAIMRRLRAGRGLEHIEVASAGTGALPDYPAPHPVVEAARDHGLDVTGHRSQHLNSSLFDWADIILVMESYMRDEIELVWPEKNPDKIFLLSSFAPGNTSTGDIDDPYGGPPEGFQRCFEEIETSVQGLLETLMSENALTPEE